MEINHISLSASEINTPVKVISIVFGVVCIAVAVFWLNFNIQSLKTDRTLYITIIFLSGFGIYQILSGLGKTARYIEIGSDFIKLKKTAVLPPLMLRAGEIEKVELYPLNLIFFTKTKKKIILRFGTTYYETGIRVKDEIMNFAEQNNVPFEIIEEEL
jgi:hypothetical protein